MPHCPRNSVAMTHSGDDHASPRAFASAHKPGACAETPKLSFIPQAAQHVQCNGSELSGMAQPMSRLILSSVLKEITHVFPPPREAACDRTVPDPVMPANMGNISGMPVEVRLSLAEASATAQLGEHQTEDQKVSSKHLVKCLKGNL